MSSNILICSGGCGFEGPRYRFNTRVGADGEFHPFCPRPHTVATMAVPKNGNHHKKTNGGMVHVEMVRRPQFPAPMRLAPVSLRR